ncbi:tetratricopeptide repeat protein [Massilibacteroides vaginae]|uniref:tetratricopeptide repeat protein n=1 Tax=Massilibacteroides vaginae TaxID=1673718 RepID=UPI00111C6EDD|nr:tetratricopeptide repeat protein [Massilibacteroides vaginae]
MRSCYILILLLCVCLTFSCNKTTESVLSEFDLVEAVMWEHPDSALALLEKMPKPAPSDKLNDATWCLLYTQARDKNYIKHTSDSLINIALQYFDSKNDWRRKAQAWFYKGQILQDLNKEDEAALCYVKVKDLLNYFDEPLFASLVCQTLGRIYRNQQLYDIAFKEFREGIHYALKASKGDILSHAYSELGRSFAECAEWDSTQYYFERSLENARLINDLYAEAMCIGDLGVLFRAKGDYEKALRYNKEGLQLNIQQGNIRNLAQNRLNVGTAYYQIEKLDSAIFYLKDALQTSNIYIIRGANMMLYLIAKKQGNYIEAIDYNEEYLIYNDSIKNIDKTKAIAEVQVKYDNEKLDNERKDLLLKNDRLQKAVLGAGILFILLVSSIAIIYQRKLWLQERHIRKAQEEVQRYLAKLHDNEVAIRENQELIQDYSEELEAKGGLEGLVNNQSEQINSLRDRIKYLQSQNTEFQQEINKYAHSVKEYDEWVFTADKLSKQNLSLKKREQFLTDYINNHVDLFRDLREKPRNTPNWTYIFESIDILYNRFYRRLREEFTLLTNEDIQVCCLIRIGLTTSQIAELFSISAPSITKKKYRIRERINQQKDNFLTDNMALDMYLKKY